MTLWTIMPEAIVFAPAEPAAGPYDEIEFGGARMLVEKIAADQCRIVRLLSTDPADYLRSELQPGQVLTAGGYELVPSSEQEMKQ
ncbi:MAG: YlzJ-like family protein [Sporomusaceae bacterium]|nr:YlzJ-like family protein [Sporomusaceae bacterium]